MGVVQVSTAISLSSSLSDGWVRSSSVSAALRFPADLVRVSFRWLRDILEVVGLGVSFETGDSRGGAVFSEVECDGPVMDGEAIVALDVVEADVEATAVVEEEPELSRRLFRANDSIAFAGSARPGGGGGGPL